MKSLKDFNYLLSLDRRYTKTESEIFRTELKQHPNVKSLFAVQGVLAACERELGFTPASRARVSPAQKEEEEKDDFDGF